MTSGRHAATADPVVSLDQHRDGPLRPPGDTSGLVGVLRHPYLLKLLVQKELRVRYQQSLLGLAWSYIQPLVRFLIYFLVIGYVLGLQRGVPNYALHIFAGMIIVNFFSEALNAGSGSVLSNGSLVRKMNLPRETFPVATLLVTAYHSFPQYVVLTVGVVIVGWQFDLVAVAAFVLSYALIFTFSLAIALAFSALTVFYRDFKNFVQVMSQLVMWSTPMIYTWDMVAERTQGNWFEQVYLANPAAEAVLLSQRAFWIPTLGDETDTSSYMPEHLLERGLIMLAISLVLVWLAQRLFKRLEARFAENL